MVYTATIMPFQIFFVENYRVPGWIAVEVVVSVFFCVDMLQSFNLAIPTSHHVEVTCRYGLPALHSQACCTTLAAVMVATNQLGPRYRPVVGVGMNSIRRGAPPWLFDINCSLVDSRGCVEVILCNALARVVCLSRVVDDRVGLRKTIAKNYLSSWFLIDLMALLPIGGFTYRGIIRESRFECSV